MQIEWFKSNIIPLRRTLYLTALKYLQQEEEAEDAVQETLLRLWNIREQVNGIDNPAAFATQVVKNICIDRLRVHREKIELNDSYLEINHKTPYSETEERESVHLVKQIIERLPELQKNIIRMRDIEGYELQEIADITGTQASAVTVNLSRARKKIREQFVRIMNFKLVNDEQG